MRTPGTPLTEAERQQRVEAAKARWEKWREGAAAAVGAGIAQEAARRGINAVAARAEAKGERQAVAAEQRVVGRILRHDTAARRQSRRAGAEWPMGPYYRANNRRARLAAKDEAAEAAKVPSAERLARQRPRAVLTEADAQLRGDIIAGGAVEIPPGPAYNKVRARLPALRAMEEVASRWPHAATAEELKRYPSTQALMADLARVRARVAGAVPKLGREVTRPRDGLLPGRTIKPEVAARLAEVRAARGEAVDRALRAKQLINWRPDPTKWRIAGEDNRPYPQRAQGPMAERLWQDRPYELGGVPGPNRRTRAWPTMNDLSAMRAEMRSGLGDRHLRFATRERAKGAAAAGAARQAAEAVARRWKGASTPARVGAALLGAAGAYALARTARKEPVETLAKADTPTQAQLTERTERSLARRLASLFTAWGADPARAGSTDAVEDAVSEPIREAFERMGGLIMPPPPPSGDLQAWRPGPEIGFNFDMRAPRVEQQLRDYSLGLIRNLSDTSREAVRTALVLGATTGATIPEQARLIRQSVGLAPGQVQWVHSYKVQLQRLDPRVLDRALRDARFDPTIKKAIASGTPLSPEQIERMVDAYHRRTLAYRATTIARTEAIRATNNAAVAQTRAMVEQDLGLEVEKTWITAGDERVRHSHQRLNGQKVIGLDTPFETVGEDGKPVFIRWPHDPMAPAGEVINCRCVIGVRVIPRQNAGRQLVAEAV